MKKRLLSVLLCVLLCLGMMPVSAIAAETKNYLALGDSITTGYGLNTETETGFATLVAEEKGYDLVNVAVNGNTVTGIAAQLSDTANEMYISADLIKSADLVTITCGGNDLMALLYTKIAEVWNNDHPDDTIDASDVVVKLANKDLALMGIALQLLDENNENYLIRMTTVNPETGAEEPSEFALALEAYIQGLVGITQYIKGVNPDVKIIVATQYNPYVEFNDVSMSVLFSTISLDPIYEGMEDGVGYLNVAIKNAQATGGYTVADVKATFDNKTEDLYNADSTLANLNVDFHPNAAGHAVLADVVVDVVGLLATCNVEAICDEAFGTVEGGGEYSVGADVTLEATSKDSAVFRYWLDTSVDLGDNFTEQQLKEAIVSYEPRFTFKAKDAVYEAVFSEANECNVSAYIPGEEGEYAYLGYEFEPIAVGGKATTLTGDDIGKLIYADGKYYDFTGFFDYYYDEENDTFVEEIVDTFEIDEEPLYSSAEWYTWQLGLSDGITVAYAPHTHNYADATCVSPKTCACSATIDEVDPDNHIETEIRNSKEATHLEEGYTGDTYCTGCDEKLAEGDSIATLPEHTFGENWHHSLLTHYKKCDCGATSDAAEHSFNVSDTVCDVCGFASAAENALPVNIGAKTVYASYVLYDTGESDKVKVNELDLSAYSGLLTNETNVIIDASDASSADEVEVELPAGAVDYIADNSESGVKVQTRIGSLTLTNDELDTKAAFDTYGFAFWRTDDRLSTALKLDGRENFRTAFVPDAAAVTGTTTIDVESRQNPELIPRVINQYTTFLNAEDEKADIKKLSEYTANGVSYYLYETVVSNGKKFVIYSISADTKELRLIDVETGEKYSTTNLTDFTSVTDDVVFELKHNTKLYVNSVKYNVYAVLTTPEDTIYILHKNSEFAGAYNQADGVAYFCSGKSPAELIASNMTEDEPVFYLPEDVTIGDVTAKSEVTYNFKFIAEHDISVKGIENLQGTVTQSFNNLNLSANTKVYSAHQHHGVFQFDLGATQDENPTDFTEVHTSVNSFSPFVVITANEVPEPEYKTLGADIGGETYILGDTDGKVNVKDATAIQKHVAKITTLDEKALIRAEVDVDGRLTVKDATAIQKFVAKYKLELDIGKELTY